MQTNCQFFEKFADLIVSVLHCHDRVIFKGYLPFGDDAHLNRFVDHVLKIRRIDFLPLVEQYSQQLVDHAKAQCAAADVPYLPLQGKGKKKEQLIQDLLRERPVQEGLVAVLCCQETCRTVKLEYGKQRPRLVFRHRPQRVLYYYFLDAEFGLMHIRIQTWFPFTIQVYVNGHEWLAQQMRQRGIAFTQRDNAFTDLDPQQMPAIQKLADRFPKLDWVKILNRLARRVNPLLGSLPWLRQRDYYWVIDQAEYSTDILFRRRSDLAELFPRLLDHALLHFSAQDILTFLGRRLHPRFDGEVLTDCKKDRWPGARIKHRMKNNWLKMYDKFGQILRVETVINQPREFRVRRLRTRKGCQEMAWCPMNKGVANFYHYHAVAHAANLRYLNALAVIDKPTASRKILDRVCEPVKYKGRRRRGLNLLRAEEQQLFAALVRAEHYLNGFRACDVARHLFGSKAADAAEARRRTAKVSRLLQLLRAHGLIKKIPHSYRYQVTDKGQRLIAAAIHLRHKTFPKELETAA